MTETIDGLLDYIEELEDELDRVTKQRDKAVENLERFCGNGAELTIRRITEDLKDE